MSFPLARNPSRLDLLWLAGPGGTVRAIRDPATGTCFAWKAGDARHAEVANRLGLIFRTRHDLQQHSFVIEYGQIEATEAADLVGVLRALDRQPGGGWACLSPTELLPCQIAKDDPDGSAG